MAGAGTNGTERGKTMPPARLLVADDLCRELRPDLVLMDVSMPGMDGLEATREIKAHHPEVIMLMVTAFEDPEYLLEAIRAGAPGYVLRHDDRDRLIGVIRRTLGGESPLNQDVAMRLLRRLATENRRQKQVPEPDWGPVVPPPGCTVVGTAGKDVISASQSPGDDTICTLGGDDQVDAGAGDDTVKGGGGADTLVGGSGSDKVYGEAGAGTLNVKDGVKDNDLADGGSGIVETERTS